MTNIQQALIRLGSRLRQSRLVVWFERQMSVASFIRTFFACCFFGFVPGAWSIGLPLLSLYGLFKIRSIGRFIIHQGSRAFRFVGRFSQSSGEVLGDLISHRTADCAKGLFAFLILFSIPMPFCFLGIYGLYRYSNEQWKQICQSKLSSLYRFCMGVLLGIQSRTTFYKRLTIALVLSPFFAGFVYYQGWFFIFNVVFSLAQYGAICVGFSAFFRDLGYALRNPIWSVLNLTGITLGSLWGRFLAHTIFPGRIYGNMGPAVGQVVQNGFLNSVFSSFLMPSSWFVGFETGFAYLLTSRISSFLHGIMNSVFFSYDMQLYGDFYGYIGPTSFQIFLMIGLGALIGYGVDCAVDGISHSMRSDVRWIHQSIENDIRQNPRTVNRLRWFTAYVVGSAPLFLVSPLGAPVLGLTAGNIMLANLVIMGLSATGLLAVGGVAWGVQSAFSMLWRSVRGNSAPVQQQQLAEPAPQNPVSDINLERPANPAWIPQYQAESRPESSNEPEGNEQTASPTQRLST